MSNNCSKVLVTGGAGFIGSHLADRLLNEGFEVTVIDNLSTGSLENIAHHQSVAGFHFLNGDIRQLGFVRKALRDIDAVFHEAALVSVPLSFSDPILANEINLSGTVNLLTACRDVGIKDFIFASSAAVYGYKETAEKKEEDIPDPASPYGIAKLAAEKYVQLFQEVYGLKTVCLRYFNVFGPRQRVDLNSGYGSVISIFIKRILQGQPPIIYGDGKQTRDFVYVEDVAEANMLALKSKNAAGEIFNIGTGKNTSINEIAVKLLGAMNRKALKSIYSEPRTADPKHGFANIDKARKVLGYVPKFTIEEGLRRLVSWYAGNSCPNGSCPEG
jgi:nucleoside-diphosphate-sugar epimerase